jgi:hypothetical protein
MQRELTAELAKIGGLEVVSLRDYDCLLFSRGETLKMFRPSSKRILMGSPQGRRVTGEIIVVFEGSLKPLRPPSKRHDYTDIIFAAPIENFAGFTVRSSLVDGSFDPVYFARMAELFEALPNDRGGWQATFGTDFFERPFIHRMEKVIHFLRESVNFEDPVPDGIHIEISISDPFSTRD